MNDDFFLSRQTDELINALPAREYLSQKILSSQSPFVPRSLFSRVKIALANGWLWVTEKLLGTNIYVENEIRELFFIDSRIRSLLLTLIEKEIVSSWTRIPTLPDLPPIIRYSVQMNPYKLPSGRILDIQGNCGDGTGHTPSEALIPALAEALERYSLCAWNPKKIIHGSYEELRSRGAIAPTLFSFFSEKQLSTDAFARSVVTVHTKMGWTLAQSFITKKKHLIPAQLVYILYCKEHPHESYFLQPTTNGAAAGISFDQATYRAICEAIERDGLFNFWLSGIAPPVIMLESIPFQGIQEQIARIKQQRLELFILDITTDLGVPSFCAVLIDRFGKMAVSMSAVADFDVAQALEKLVFEVLKFPHQIITESGTATFESIQKKYPNVETFAERRLLWSRQEMIPQIEFFLRGQKKDFSDIKNKDAHQNLTTKLHAIKNTLKEKQYNCFLVDATSDEARRAGLFVVKAIIPQLMPAYFNEKEKYLGIKRLYELPITLGYRAEPLTESELNPIPHPFV